MDGENLQRRKPLRISLLKYMFKTSETVGGPFFESHETRNRLNRWESMLFQYILEAIGRDFPDTSMRRHVQKTGPVTLQSESLWRYTGLFEDITFFKMDRL